MSRTVGIIGGSIAGYLEVARGEPHTVTTDWGAPPGGLIVGQSGASRTVFVARHGPEGVIPPHKVNYRALIAALQAAGCDCIVALNAVGGIAPDATTGRLAVPHQLIDYSWGREHTFHDGDAGTLEFVDFTSPYDASLRAGLISAAREARADILGTGVYGATQGPRLETAAEIDRLERDGCTLVGMTGMPEAGLARELGLPYASLCQIVNRAAGRSATSIHAEIEAALVETARATSQVLENFLRGQFDAP